jgi:hypothetical protein
MKVREKVDSGEIYVGEEVVQTSYTSYTTNKENQLEAKQKHVFARKFPLSHIRKELLDKHEHMGLIRDNTDSYFADLTKMELKHKLESLNEKYDPACMHALNLN